MACSTCAYYSFAAGECRRLSETWPKRELTGWCGQWKVDEAMAEARHLRLATHEPGKTDWNRKPPATIAGAKLSDDVVAECRARADAIEAKRRSV